MGKIPYFRILPLFVGAPPSILIALIPGLNNQVCDGQTTVDEPCDSLCGGAGCGKCGGISCLDGALSKAGEAVKSAEQADKLLREKDSEAQQILGKISQVCMISFSKPISRQLLIRSSGYQKTS